MPVNPTPTPAPRTTGERSLVDRLHAANRCTRCNCSSCTREGAGELHDHVCTDGPGCFETRAKLRALLTSRAILCCRAATALTEAAAHDTARAEEVAGLRRELRDLTESAVAASTDAIASDERADEAESLASDLRAQLDRAEARNGVLEAALREAAKTIQAAGLHVGDDLTKDILQRAAVRADLVALSAGQDAGRGHEGEPAPQHDQGG